MAPWRIRSTVVCMRVRIIQRGKVTVLKPAIATNDSSYLLMKRKLLFLGGFWFIGYWVGVDAQPEIEQVNLLLPYLLLQMHNNLTNLHSEFLQQHQQLTQLSASISQFMGTYVSTRHVRHSNARTRLSQLQSSLRAVRDQFSHLRSDLGVYGQLPAEIAKVAAGLPAIYEGFWRSKEEQLQGNVEEKDKQIAEMRQQLETKSDEIAELRQRIVLLQGRQIISKASNLQLMRPKRIGIPLKAPQRQQFDSYIDQIEVTVRESQQPLFKKITEEREDQDSAQESTQRVMLETTDASLQVSSGRRLFSGDFAQYYSRSKGGPAPRKAEVENQNTNEICGKTKQPGDPPAKEVKEGFWSKFAAKVPAKPHKSQKSRSVSKENLNKTLQFCKLKPSPTPPSKIADLRRMLYQEKNAQRLSFKF